MQSQLFSITAEIKQLCYLWNKACNVNDDQLLTPLPPSALELKMHQGTRELCFFNGDTDMVKTSTP